MGRAEVVRGLERIRDNDMDGPCPDDALRAAIELLHVPDSAEVQAAREALHFNNVPHYATLERALDALARESEHPLIVVDVVCECGATPRRFALGYHDAESPLPPANATVPVFSCGACRDQRIAVLETKLTRVREYADWLEAENIDERVAHALREKLDEATP